MKKQPTHCDRVLRVLMSAKGSMSAAAIANRAKVPLASVYKRVHELRTERGLPIVTEYKYVNGRRKVFYVLTKITTTTATG